MVYFVHKPGAYSDQFPLPTPLWSYRRLRDPLCPPCLRGRTYHRGIKCMEIHRVHVKTKSMIRLFTFYLVKHSPYRSFSRWFILAIYRVLTRINFLYQLLSGVTEDSVILCALRASVGRTYHRGIKCMEIHRVHVKTKS